MSEEIKRAMDRAMKVSDLIAELQGLDEDAPVFFVCDYGDYCHTQQALLVKDVEQVKSENIETSAYSHSGVKLELESPDEYEEHVEGKMVVILSQEGLW